MFASISSSLFCIAIMYFHGLTTPSCLIFTWDGKSFSAIPSLQIRHFISFLPSKSLPCTLYFVKASVPLSFVSKNVECLFYFISDLVNIVRLAYQRIDLFEIRLFFQYQRRRASSFHRHLVKLYMVF